LDDWWVRGLRFLGTTGHQIPSVAVVQITLEWSPHPERRKGFPLDFRYLADILGL
jgi:hypothetical protein